VERNNTELLSNWGNLVNRVLNMTQRYFNGVVPDPGPLTEVDETLLSAVDAGFDSIGALYDACKFRAALQETMALSTRVNQYLEETQPWKTAKTDMQATARSLYVTLQAINGLKILFAPVLPFTSQAIHEMLAEEGQLFGDQKVESYDESERSHIALTYDATHAVGSWGRVVVPDGRTLPKPAPLFKKLDESVVEDELARLGK
jgi:methionyl-tRNA synthetase